MISAKSFFLRPSLTESPVKLLAYTATTVASITTTTTTIYYIKSNILLPLQHLLLVQLLITL